MIRIPDQIIGLLQLIADRLQQILDKLTHIERAVLHLASIIIRGMTNELDEWLTKEEAMAYLGIRRSTYYRWIAEGILKPRGRAGEDKFFKADLTAIVRERGKRRRMRPRQRKKS